MVNDKPSEVAAPKKGGGPEVPAATGVEAAAGRARGSRPPKKNWRRLTPAPGDQGMLQIFWWLVVLMLGALAITSLHRPAVCSAAALLVGFFALLPAYLWCSGAVTGLPIFPIYAGMFLPTHALQYALAEPRLTSHSNDSIWLAAGTVSVFLLLATMVWYLWVSRPHPVPASSRVLSGQRGTTFLLLILAASTIETLCDQAGWLAGVPGGVLSLVRNFFSGPTAFAVFVLAFRWGSRSLQPEQIVLFLGLFLAYCIVGASSLFLVSAVVMSVMLIFGFTIGRNRVPVLWAVSLLAVLGFLHAGKDEMRSRYWAEGEQGAAIQPWNYASFYAEWFKASGEEMVFQKESGEEKQNIVSRANTLFLLLQAEEMAPSEVPFLNGATYAIIPGALVPRLFNSQKVSPLDSTSLLNVTFGNETWEQTKSTTIGWGLLEEAYANFGYPGCLALALILPLFYAAMTRWGIGLPPTSLPSLVGIFTISFAIQSEMTAAVYIVTYVQSLTALLVMIWPFTERVALLPRQQDNETTGRRDY